MVLLILNDTAKASKLTILAFLWGREFVKNSITSNLQSETMPYSLIDCTKRLLGRCNIYHLLAQVASCIQCNDFLTF